MLRRILLVLTAIVALYWSLTRTGVTVVDQELPATQPVTTQSQPSVQADDQVDQQAREAEAVLRRAVDSQQSHVQLRIFGTIEKVLPDDTSGSRHQRFLVRTASGVSVLIAHNIDLASRISSLSAGDAIECYGEYEWNNKGGVVHWTHHDPNGRHAAGWIKHHGQTYQ